LHNPSAVIRKYRTALACDKGSGGVEFTQLSTINPKNPTGDDDANGARRVEIFTAGNRNKFWGRIDAAKLIYIIYNIHRTEPASEGTNN